MSLLLRDKTRGVGVDAALSMKSHFFGLEEFILIVLESLNGESVM